MTMGSEANNVYQPTAELRNWKKTGRGYSGIVYNDLHKIIQDGSPHNILESAIKHEHDLGEHYLVVTMGWKWKLLKSEEVT